MKQQQGGTIIGIIIGLMLGLGIALAVAVYVTKVPVPFLNKNQTRSANQDAEEELKNQNWNPNAALSGRNTARKPVATGSVEQPVIAPAGEPPLTTAVSAGGAPVVAAGNTPAATNQTELALAKPASSDPLGDLVRARTNAPAATSDPFDYFVQAGAYRTTQDAEQQRARLAIMGLQAKVSQREQNGQIVYRVRIGAFDQRDNAEKIKEKLVQTGMDAVLVRVQR